MWQVLKKSVHGNILDTNFLKEICRPMYKQFISEPVIGDGGNRVPCSRDWFLLAMFSLH